MSLNENILRFDVEGGFGSVSAWFREVNLNERGRVRLVGLEILRRHAGPGEGLLAVLDRGAPHISFHVGKAGATCAGRAVNARGTTGQIAQPDRARTIGKRH
jgi:hypothetical protein